jgi:DNA anti-recombination protein RmuC
MKKSWINALAGMALVLTMAVFTGCGGNKTTESTTEEISMQMQQEINAVKDELSTAQMKLNDQLAKIDEKLATADDAAKVKLEEIKMKLQKESEKLNNQLAELNGDLEQGWESVKSESRQLVKNVENSIKALDIDI